MGGRVKQSLMRYRVYCIPTSQTAYRRDIPIGFDFLPFQLWIILDFLLLSGAQAEGGGGGSVAFREKLMVK